MPARGAAQQARTALGERIAELRHEAGLTQPALGALIGYSRVAVSYAETGRRSSREFCLLAGRKLGVGDELARAHDRITALTSAARRPRNSSRPLTGEDTDLLVLSRDRDCPHCGKPLAVLIRQELSLLPLEVALPV